MPDQNKLEQLERTEQVSHSEVSQTLSVVSKNSRFLETFKVINIIAAIVILLIGYFAIIGTILLPPVRGLSQGALEFFLSIITERPYVLLLIVGTLWLSLSIGLYWKSRLSLLLLLFLSFLFYIFVGLLLINESGARSVIMGVFLVPLLFTLYVIMGTLHILRRRSLFTQRWRDPFDRKYAITIVLFPCILIVVAFISWFFIYVSSAAQDNVTIGFFVALKFLGSYIFGPLFLGIIIAILLIRKKSLTPDALYDERSGKGKRSSLPPELRGWNWAAAGLGPIWGVYHRVWISLLGLLPIIDLFWWIVMGIKGNTWAWSKNRWESIDTFRAYHQRAWKVFGILFTIFRIINTVGIFFLLVLGGLVALSVLSNSL